MRKREREPVTDTYRVETLHTAGARTRRTARLR